MLRNRGNKTIGTKGTGVVVPEAVSFDGDTDYMSRDSDLVGNVDSKTFTFSCWGYRLPTGDFYIYDNSENGIYFVINANGRFDFIGDNASDTKILQGGTADGDIPLNTYFNLIVSLDLSDTNKRHCYINDKEVSLTWSTYIDDLIDFTATSQYIGQRYTLSNPLYGRLSNYFLDYTYRDLSIEANRRLFITADGKPAEGLASLNPILYLPMKDKATAHINEGTGGNFVQNGLIETADRGANQPNCVMSVFDSSEPNWLDNADIGASNSKVVVASWIIDIYGSEEVLSFGFDVANRLRINTNTTSISILYEVDNNISINFLAYHPYVAGATINCSLVIDTVDQSKTVIIVEGISLPITYTDFIVDTEFILTNSTDVGRDLGSNEINTALGEVYFDTNYIDLATSNPFWDSDTNKPIPVRTAMANLGSNPLICMPIDASNPIANYGSGGDFTLNGGGLLGARGSSEFISRSCGSTAALENTNFLETSAAGLPEVLTSFSAVIAVQNLDISAASDTVLFSLGSKDDYTVFTLFVDASEDLKYCMGNTTDRPLVTDAFITTDWQNIFIRGNSVNSVIATINGVDYVGAVWEDLTTTLDRVSVLGASLQVTGSSSSDWRGNTSSTYFTTDYIDFSQEANRNLFVNQLGYPRDLQPLIDEGTIPNPLIYLKFDDTDNLGKNNGTGGDFTVNGTVTAGADFKI